MDDTGSYPFSLQGAAPAGGDVLLSWPHPTPHEETHRHRTQLQRLHREGRTAWVLFDSVMERTRFGLNFSEHTFHPGETPEAIRAQLRQWFVQTYAFDRVYLLAQAHAEAPCYEITEYVQRCLAGDTSVAERLKGRTVFRLYQTEIDAFDLLADSGVDDLANQVLKRYVHEFADFLDRTIVGFCCNAPTFLSPLQSNPLSVPWSLQLDRHFRTIPEPTVLPYLPLLFYETYDSATVRSIFWEQLTRQFAEVCIGGLRQFCHRWNLRFALHVPATARALEIDIGTILQHADAPILRANGIEQPRQFLIAKCIASRPGPESSGQISICRSGARAGIDAHVLASDSALGFNSWMRTVSREGAVTSADRTLRSGGPAAQLQQFLSIGAPQRSILILSPVHSLWTKPEPKTWNWMTKAWSWLCQTVWDLGYDFDIASETEVAQAEVDKGERALCLKGGGYRAVLLSSCLSLQEATVARLTQFVKARGKLIAAEPVPYLLNGRIGIEPYPLERLLYRWRTSILRGTDNEKVAQLKRLLQKRIKPAMQIYVKPDNLLTTDIIAQHRQSPELDVFYLFNRSDLSFETLIEIRWEAKVEAWDAETGEEHALDHWHANGNTYMAQSFEPQRGRLIVARRNAS